MRIIQISDTHLSPGKAHFADNWPPLARPLFLHRPDGGDTGYWSVKPQPRLG